MSESATIPSTEAPGENQPQDKSRNGPRLWFHNKKERARNRFWKEYDGSRGFNGKYLYKRPHRQPTDDLEKAFDIAGTIEVGKDGKYEYLNQLGQISRKYQDVDTYLSPTTYTPRRLLVQATAHVYNSTNHSTKDWRRRKIEGSVPLALKMAEWALGPATRDPDTGKRSAFGGLLSLLRIMVVGLPLQLLLAFPGANAPWEADQIEDAYLDYPGYHWKWAKHAINPLDERPGSNKSVGKPKRFSSTSRLLRPRQLVVYREGHWKPVNAPSPDLQYVFVSYANIHFNTSNSARGRQQIERMAEHVTLQAGCNAYWLDYECRAPADQPALLTADVNRMCDVIRGANRVVVMLPDPQDSSQPKSLDLLMEEWGKRMWTLPEGLLAPGNVHFCYPVQGDTFKVISLHKVEMTERVWKDLPMDDDNPPTRILAEHYSGHLNLSRLDLFATALAALGRDREPENLFTDADVAYALMGLLHYRIEPDETDSLFQALARLSLANDNDRLIERMVCMYPNANHTFRDLFKTLSQKDQYETHLWDISPLCQVVGVGDEPNTVLLNNCRAISIRWKKFPQMQYRRHAGFKKFLAELFVRSGAWWIVGGASLAWTYAPFLLANSNNSSGDSNQVSGTLVTYLEVLVGIFLAVGFLLSFFGPHSVRRLFGGAVLQTTPHLIGFEGVLPIRELETLMFGNYSHRLSYEPSSTPFCLNNRHPERREGLEPQWVKDNPDNPEPPLQGKDQRIFTLVDTGNLTVSIFSAQRPPTVALICGSEGGMLRTVLCSWRFSTDCLFREAVIRMPHDTFDQAKAKSWLKVSLGNQEDFTDAVKWQREKLWKKKQESAHLPMPQMGEPQMRWDSAGGESSSSRDPEMQAWQPLTHMSTTKVPEMRDSRIDSPSVRSEGSTIAEVSESHT